MGQVVKYGISPDYPAASNGDAELDGEPAHGYSRERSRRMSRGSDVSGVSRLPTGNEGWEVTGGERVTREGRVRRQRV